MQPAPEYPYAEGDLLTTPMIYSYSEASGVAFLRKYLRFRSVKVTELSAEPKLDEPLKLDPMSKHQVFNMWRNWNATMCEGSPPPGVTLFLKRFAVSKRVWDAYTEDLRPQPYARHTDLKLYAQASELALASNEISGDLRYLNIALQLNDILCAYSHELKPSEKLFLLGLISRELFAVMSLLRDEAS